MKSNGKWDREEMFLMNTLNIFSFKTYLFGHGCRKQICVPITRNNIQNIIKCFLKIIIQQPICLIQDLPNTCTLFQQYKQSMMNVGNRYFITPIPVNHMKLCQATTLIWLHWLCFKVACKTMAFISWRWNCPK